MRINTQLSGCSPILCADLLRTVDRHLVDLLGSLTSEEWDLQTTAPRWKVRDVAAHLLDTALRKLSLVRDSWLVENANVQSPADVIALVNRLNDEGVAVYRRLSPGVLIGLMTIACDQPARFHKSLDPFARATFNVSWAGEDVSVNWFDTARELTERWRHQEQIRLTTGRPGIMTPELYHPVLDCFLRGMPYAYRHTNSSEGTNVLLEISGECGGSWVLTKGIEGWHFAKERPNQVACKVTLPQAIAWRVFTKGMDHASARQQARIEGDVALADGIFGLTAIVG